MKLYIMRHGEVELNVKKLLNGRNDSELTKTGILETEGKRREVRKLDINQIFCSPLARAKQTCDIVNETHVPVVYDDRLMERDTGHLMYMPSSAVNNEVFYDTSKEVIYGDCEGFGSIRKRVQSFLTDSYEKYEDKTIFIVTHLDTCRAFYSVIYHVAEVSKIVAFHQGNSEIAAYEIGKEVLQ